MGKIVKYCNTCEEGFAIKFGFCPNCGEQLQAFEMVSPIGNTYIPQTKKVAEEPQNLPETLKTEAVTEEIPVFPFETNDYQTETAPITASEAMPTGAEVSTAAAVTESFDAKEFEAQQIVVEEPEFVEESPKTYAASADNSDGGYRYSNSIPAQAASDGFHITVIEAKNVKQRNLLFLGSLFFIVITVLGGTVYSLFNKDLLVGSIDQGDLVAFVPEVEPVQMDKEPEPKKAKDDGGGGGGGGKDEKTPVQKGVLATQIKDPIIAPSKSMDRITNPAIPIQMATQGNNPRPITNDVYGLKNGTGNNSDGMGSGGGMGSGNGRGMGSGRGTGEGTGIGSGSGGGTGPGDGDGTGVGGNNSRNPPPPPPIVPKRASVTTAFKLISKPKALYTDAARQNNVQGNVTLRVTFLANGQIGSISPVSGLPYGLTEQAIAAARNIRFEPQMVDGVPKSVTKTLQFSFTIY